MVQHQEIFMKTRNDISKPLFAACAAATLLSISGAAAQNVGIGISNPQSKLTVNGNLAVGNSTFNVAAPVNGAIIQGNVGIGTITPRAPLDVTISSVLTETGGVRTFFDFATAPVLTQQTVTTTTNVASAVFSQSVFTGNAFISYGGTLTASDARLKNIIGNSDGATDLEILKKIEVTDYTMKDAVTFGNRLFKKVVAQQVEKVYPTAVSTIGYKSVTFTPDIYAVSSSVKFEGQNVYTVSLTKTHGLKEGEMLRLITEKNSELNVVAHVVDDKTFTVTTKEPLDDKVFVYGKQCLDLKSVDYDAIAMLNVSATQELAKKVEALEAENSQLKAESRRLTAVEQQNAKLAAQMEALEKSVAASNHQKSATSQAVALSY